MGMTKEPNSEELTKLADVDQLFPSRFELSDSLPDVGEMPPKAQMILCLVACGFSYRTISLLAGCKAQTVQYYVDRWDPDRRFGLGDKGRREFLAALWQSRAGEALAQITPEKLAVSSARDCAYVAKVAGEAREKLETGRKATPSSFENQLKVLAEVSDD